MADKDSKNAEKKDKIFSVLWPKSVHSAIYMENSLKHLRDTQYVTFL